MTWAFRRFVASLVSWQFMVLPVLAGASMAVMGAGAAPVGQEPGARGLQEQQLMRQQQQDALRLRMQQQNRSLQSPPSGAQQRQTRERMQIEQRQRQEQLHYRQETRPPTPHAGDDAGVQRAKAQMDSQRAKEEGDQQLRRFDSELQKGVERPGAAKARGEVRPPQPDAPLQ